MELLFWVGTLFGSLAVLVFSADKFTQAAERVGLFFGLSSFIVGAAIVSVGSSLPELATSVIGVLKGVNNLPISNAIGSNIANCLLVGGISALAVGTLRVKQKLIDVDLPFFFISTALFLVLAMDKTISVFDAVIMLLMFSIFVIYTIFNEEKNTLVAFVQEHLQDKTNLTVWDGLGILGGMAGIYLGAHFTVQSITEVAGILQIGSSVVAMLAVAIGTSLPELVVSVRAALAGNHSIALGNIFGSNTFNILAVTGIPAFFGAVEISAEAWTIGVPFLIVTTLAFIFTTSDDRIQKWEGYALLVLYVAFVGKITGMI